MKRLFVLSLVLIMLSCNSQENHTESSNQNTQEVNSIQKPTSKRVYYTSVENLRLRKEPTISSEIVSTLKKNTKLLFSFEYSDKKDRITINEKEFYEYWYKVQVSDTKQEGWVFGGGISAAITKEQNQVATLSLSDLKKTYKNLPNDCEVISQYFCPDTSIIENLTSSYTQIKLDNDQIAYFDFWNFLSNPYNEPDNLIEYDFFPVFLTEQGDVKIMFGDVIFSDEADEKWTSWFKDKKIIQQPDEYMETREFPKIDKEFQTKDYWIKIITNKRTITTRLVKYSEYVGECLAYSSLDLHNVKLEKDEFPLFGSLKNIEVDYKIPVGFQQQYQNLIRKACVDCSNNNEDEKIVARVKNTNIYLVANALQDMEELNTHDRSIFYITEDIALSLFSEQIDYYGCPCL